MARYNEILTGRYNRFIQKLFSMKGPPPVPQLSGDVQVSFPFFSGVEHRYLESWDRYVISIAVGAQGAGVASGMRLRNPSGSNVIAVVEKILFANITGAAASMLASLGVTGTDLGTIQTGSTTRHDARGRPQPSTVPSTGAGGALANLLQVRLAIDQSWDSIQSENQEVTILPGDALTLTTLALNVANTYTIWWRERALEESERT